MNDETNFLGVDHDKKPEHVKNMGRGVVLRREKSFPVFIRVLAREGLDERVRVLAVLLQKAEAHALDVVHECVVPVPIHVIREVESGNARKRPKDAVIRIGRDEAVLKDVLHRTRRVRIRCVALKDPRHAQLAVRPTPQHHGLVPDAGRLEINEHLDVLCPRVLRHEGVGSQQNDFLRAVEKKHDVALHVRVPRENILEHLEHDRAHRHRIARAVARRRRVQMRIHHHRVPPPLPLHLPPHPHHKIPHPRIRLPHRRARRQRAHLQHKRSILRLLHAHLHVHLPLPPPPPPHRRLRPILKVLHRPIQALDLDARNGSDRAKSRPRTPP
mmetsp:Transcript_22265/g.59203  ORF Transcript_22265/g.59203 Transcript_22265/m.59203 type:complete len:328 (+) Transcript_22265:459-1442(+)